MVYLPYFRGRQYELLALRELAKQRLYGAAVFPIVEPVKSTSTLLSTMAEYEKAGLPIALVFNPAVGSLTNKQELVEPFCELLSETVIPAVLIRGNSADTVKLLESHDIERSNMLAIMLDRDGLETYSEEFGGVSPMFTLFPDERKLRRAIGQGKVMFDDKFHRQTKNANYPEDEFFSDDHLYFQDEGYAGFGDYSIIGADYSESGFAPYAVAIHIVYFDDDRAMRIRHFISDSNDDISDVAGKFYEAITKLVDWYQAGQQRQLTAGLQQLLSHYENRTYPGLPTIKKLSLMHHLELMGKLLDGGMQQ